MCRCGMCVRGNEINKWIHDNNDIIGDYIKFKDYVILDDDNDMLFIQRHNFIKRSVKPTDAVGSVGCNRPLTLC